MDDYRLVIRVKNNLLHELMKERGIETQSELARVTNMPASKIGDIANLKIGAFNADGRPSKATESLCDYFGCLPEDLYPREVLHVGIPKNVIERVVSSEEVAKYIEQAELDPAFLLEEKMDTKYIQNEIARLNGRQQQVIRARFYEDKTYEEIAQELDVTRERIRQIEFQALRKMRMMVPSDYSGETDINTQFADAQVVRDKMEQGLQ